MKLVAPLLIGISLAMGAIACMTAYSPRLDTVAVAVEQGAEIELGAPSGRTVAPDGNAVPVAKSGDALTPELVGQLRTVGVERVRVRQFSFARWSHAWMFGLSVAGLGLGAWLLRREQAQNIREAAKSDGGSPAAAMACIREKLRDLDERFPELRGAQDGMERVTAELGELQATHIDLIVLARERIIAAGGLAGFAAFMSAFSVLERQINRAWSAAADESADEAGDCIKRALALFDDTDRLLPRG